MKELRTLPSKGIEQAYQLTHTVEDTVSGWLQANPEQLPTVAVALEKASGYRKKKR